MYITKRCYPIKDITNLVLASPAGVGIVNSTTILVPGTLYGVRPRLNKMFINPTTIDMTAALENGLILAPNSETFIFRANTTRLQTYSTVVAQYLLITYGESY